MPKQSVREGTGVRGRRPGPLHPPDQVRQHLALASGVEPMMRTDPTGLLPGLAGLEEPDCPACATGWHTRCCLPTWLMTAMGSWSSAAVTGC